MFKSFRFALLMAGALFALGAVAQPAPDQQPGDQSDPPSRVARLAYIRGTVSFVPAGENEWVEAQINRPLIKATATVSKTQVTDIAMTAGGAPPHAAAAAEMLASAP